MPLPKNPRRDDAFRVAWSCVLVPDSGVDAAQVVRLAERAVAINANDPDCLFTLGAALYRAGRFEDSSKILVQAEAAYRREEAAPTPGIYVVTTVTYCQFFLGMALERMHRHEEAAQWLKKAIEPLDRDSRPGQSPADSTWSRRLTVQLLRKEAESVVAPGVR